MKLTDNLNTILPNVFKGKKAIGITAPSSGVDIKNLSSFVKKVEEAGYKVILGKTITHVMNSDNNSASAEIRAKEFNDMVRNPEVGLVLAACGGFGSQITTQLLDYDLIAKERKPIMGFSDTTFILNAIYQKTGLVTFLGPTAEIVEYDKDKLGINYALDMLAGKFDYPKLVENFDNTIIRSISQSEKSNLAPIVGGNLTMVQMTLGTDQEIDTDGKIILLEEIGESPYTIERSLDHLFTAGKFENPAGIVFGEFTNIKTEKQEDIGDSNPSIYEVIIKKFSGADYPVLIGYNFSHDEYNLTFPIGGMARINGKKRVLEIMGNPVR
jgi:muramoyltetrapeptide carboxypeptidase